MIEKFITSAEAKNGVYTYQIEIQDNPSNLTKEGKEKIYQSIKDWNGPGNYQYFNFSFFQPYFFEQSIHTHFNFSSYKEIFQLPHKKAEEIEGCYVISFDPLKPHYKWKVVATENTPEGMISAVFTQMIDTFQILSSKSDL